MQTIAINKNFHPKENIMTDLQLNFVKIPASEFTMGSKRSLDRDAHDDEMPTTVLQVSDYFMMKYPVTNAQYNQFVQATGCRSASSAAPLDRSGCCTCCWQKPEAPQLWS